MGLSLQVKVLTPRRFYSVQISRAEAFFPPQEVFFTLHGGRHTELRAHVCRGESDEYLGVRVLLSSVRVSEHLSL